MPNILVSVLKQVFISLAIACSGSAWAGSGVGLAKIVHGFKAGNYIKSEATLASLGAKNLRYASSADNVAGILELAQKEGRIDTIQMMQLSGPYSRMTNGDALLLRCFQYSRCKPEIFLERCLQNSKCDSNVFLEVLRMSELHAEVIIRNPSLGKTQVNHAVGAINENLMFRFYTSSAWRSIDGQVGRTGFDGLFVKMDDSGTVRELLVVESKYNRSLLKPTNHGMQMSDEWVRKKIADLRQKNPEHATYHQIEELIDRGVYRARLWHLKVEDGKAKIELKALHDKDGSIHLDDINEAAERPPRVIDLGNPRGAFEKQFVSWYRDEINRVGKTK